MVDDFPTYFFIAFALLIGIVIGITITKISIQGYESAFEIPTPIKAVMVQDKGLYCAAYADYLVPDWDTTYNTRPYAEITLDPEVGRSLCSCEEPRIIGGYKWKTYCQPVVP